MPAPLLVDTIQQLVAQALEAARKEGTLQLETMPEIQVERPGNSDHGDFATNLPLRLARATRINPLELAKSLAGYIPTGDVIERVEAAPPGFINFYLTDFWLQQQVEEVRRAGDSFGNVDLGQGKKMMIEFVSVNPTGPVHVGHTRGAVLGSSLANVLEAAGYGVTREYYVNDAGSQMQAFYKSVLARYKEYLGQDAVMPENGYMGDYIADLAKEIADAEGDRFLSQEEGQALREIGDIGREKMVAIIKDDLAGIGVEFDNWFSERTLFEDGEYDAAIGILKEKDYLSERDDATWFNSTMLGDDKDNVVIRSTGEPTYFASDIAYHYNKFVGRGYSSVVDIWGADHQGHVPRMKSAVEALGIEPDRLTVLISQMVTLRRGDEVVRASKRTGQFVTLKELAEEVGKDACRFFFLARSPSTQMEFDLELAKKESAENPVYYVQYAHARNASILNLARERNIDWSDGDVSLLTDPNELNLVRAMLRLPELVAQMAEDLEPHHLPHYATELANAFHSFYENCRVVSSNEEDDAMTAARLKLVESAQIVFRRSLDLMGMNAPERM
ncbi:MAG: arginine--tRNA ligase [Chloroflexi bacterium]|nr:arginine--tRNA ligase [Chloroflexota bacterium]MDA1269685.1 arginine--tRNA ligase [Chloroflexota bacterium]PKB58084.1 MAG: arginine--tRNA ligase [SAR202 cluster bacterium Casp-Chloro-G2]